MNTIYEIYHAMGGFQPATKMPGWMVVYLLCIMVSATRLCAACFLQASSIKPYTELTSLLVMPAVLGFMSTFWLTGFFFSVFLTLVLLPSAGAPVGATLIASFFGISSVAILVSRFFRGVYA